MARWSNVTDKTGYDSPEYQQFIELLADILWESMHREAQAAQARNATSDSQSVDTGYRSDLLQDQNTQGSSQDAIPPDDALHE
jgi:hypothetical protein